ncbi:hydroxyacid dehydrogenase [Siccirubricoccus sp. KC 17139]|uniref:Hydroxyacid dehydrogenase n=1 Tax=Siccirubricoccus soli TaxID=2899147 RepID=A0ABT1D1Z1_9PROT|nr:NAD(P)-dependent oxidoreductase [Siccirubricoccus soli]MCO6415637.1 hydroxyacid dehydrogenase [Siccirubricoccus soli]MCP2681769.1 hydroxyacid dehydrogenase [Siccirubricoccus soli]
MRNRLKVYLTHPPEALANYYGDRALAALREVAEVRLNETGRHLAGRELAEAAAGCHCIISYRQSPGEATTFENAPDLIAFHRCAIDIRNVDVAAASRAGVLVTQATAGFVPAVAELVLGMMVDLCRGITAATVEYHAGQVPTAKMGRQLAGSTLGIIGYGAIGRYLAPLGLTLGMRVLVADPHATPEDARIEHLPLEEMLPECDILVCLAVANEQTENLMDAAAFACMPRGAFFINPSRGNLVEEVALLAALESGHLAGAALDVGRAPDQMPSLALARHPKVIATPHIGGLTPEAIEHQAFDTVAQVRALAEGRVPEHAVNAAEAFRLKRLGIG